MTRFGLFLIIYPIFLSLNAQSIRSIDGSFNNVFRPKWGSKGDVLRDINRNSFADGYGAMGGSDRPNPRLVSNTIFSQESLIFDDNALSDFTWVFGQFLDHEIVLVENSVSETAMIEVPQDDAFFQPGSLIPMMRSEHIAASGTDINNPRKFPNSVTAFIDGSAIYGSDVQRAQWLRTFKDGKLKTSNNNLLPWNTLTGEFNGPLDMNAPTMADDTRSNIRLFVAGDVRANENPLLLAMHTIFVREHNRICEELKLQNPSRTDEQLYQEARRWVAAYLQKIVYYDWLPVMGIRLPPYQTYRAEVNPQITNLFSAAAFRMGHTLINSNIMRLQSNGEVLSNGNLSLRDAFFNPLAINLVGGIDPYLQGMASQVQQKLDCKVIDDVRNFLFDNVGTGGLDLAAININRARERGLPDYNTIRTELGLPVVKQFIDINDDPQVGQELAQLYNIDNIDPWVGMFSEQYMPDAMFGASIMIVLEQQFQALRDGDRFYFEGDPSFSSNEKAKVLATNLRDIIMRNTSIKIMQENVFKAAQMSDVQVGPAIQATDLNAVVFPNPTLGDFSLKVFLDNDVELDVTIFDIRGSIIDRQRVGLVAGDNILNLSMPQDLPAGVYHVMLAHNSISYSLVRVFKQ